MICEPHVSARPRRAPVHAQATPGARRPHDGVALLVFAAVVTAFFTAFFTPFVAVGLAAGPGVTTARADERTDAFERANAAFAAGDFVAAQDGFAAIVAQDGPSAAVLYNLGNASFRAGRIGEAVLSYERALLLAPRDQDVRANLRQVRKAAGLDEPEPGRWTRTVRLLSADAWAWIASGALYLLCAALLALRLVRRFDQGHPARSLLRTSTVLLATTMLVAGAAAATRLGDRDRAVVLDGAPALRVAPYPSATVSSDLAPGEVVRIERTHQGFSLVRTAAGRSGWLGDDALARVASVAP